MSTERELELRLADTEDALVERKPTADRDQIRKYACAFANSIRHPDTGVLSLGVDNNGNPSGKIGDPEKTQIDVRSWITACYPAITGVQTYALTIKGQQVVAVVVTESRNRPHFTGPAWVRNGPETQLANETRFQKLIEDRTDLVWALRQWVGKQVTVVMESQQGAHRTWGHDVGDWTLADVNQFFVTLTGRTEVGDSISLRRIYLEHDNGRKQPRLRVALG